MIASPNHTTETLSAYPYHLLRAASEQFHSSIAGLSEEQREQAEQQAQRTFALENLVLASPDAVRIQIPEPQLEDALALIRSRYADTLAMEEDLARNGLDLTSLREALRRELCFDAVMQRVGARSEPISEVDARLFFELHHERFATPERRTASHILITINPDYPENQRPRALARITAAQARLAAEPGRFGALALELSECPTALQEGRLGSVPRGQLYPALDAALFSLAAGAISDVLESEIGFHLLLCEAIEPAARVSFAEARDKIHAVLSARQRRACQQAWLAELQSSSRSAQRSTPQAVTDLPQA